MITKVYGTINSTDDVIFTNIDGDLWQAEVPTNSNGLWICALYAENDSGGRAFICKVLLAITGHQMTITVLSDGYTAGAPMERGYHSEYILCDRDGSG